MDDDVAIPKFQISWPSLVAFRADGTGMAQTLLHMYYTIWNGEGIDRYHFRGRADIGCSMAPYWAERCWVNLDQCLYKSGLWGHSTFTKTSFPESTLKGVGSSVKRREGRVHVCIALFPSCTVERELVITQDPYKVSNHRNYSGTCGFNVGSVLCCGREFCAAL